MMLNRRWLYDKLLNDLFGMPSYKLGYHMLMVLTKGFRAITICPLGLNGNFKHSVKLGQTQSGLIFHYASIMITASVCFFAFLAYPDQLLIMDSRMIGLMFLVNHSHLT
jgi:hypothetical protein